MNNSSSKRSRAVFQLDAASALTLNTITLMTFMAASSAPTPLYRLYQQLWQFSPVTLTLIFATYAFTLLGSLLIIGSLSDYIGRRPVIIAAITLQIISMSFFFICFRCFDVIHCTRLTRNRNRACCFSYRRSNFRF